jgi:NAD(P)H-dependent FMN reductase
MRFVVVYGSVRTGRQGIKAARFIVNRLKKRKHQVTFIDPKKYKLPLLKKPLWDYKSKKDAPKILQKLANLYQKADGVIVVSGEYNHSIPPALTNLLNHHFKEFFWKPSAIVCYSAGNFGGIRAAMQLRIFLAEIGMPTIPLIYPISKVQDSFDVNGKALNNMYEKNIDKFLKQLEWHAEAFKNQRKKGVPND